MTEYFLPKHVFFCCRGDSVVFLDLKKDEYSMIEGDRANALRGLLFNGCSGSDISESESNSLLKDVISELVANELLSPDCVDGKPFKPTCADLPEEHIRAAETRVTAVPIRASHIWNVVASCAIAALRLRFRPIESTVTHVKQRKIDGLQRRSPDDAKTRELVDIFHRLRFIFPAGYLCLFDSLALLEFLARYHAYPDWIFAVRLEIWGAHCWVQERRTTLNEEVEETNDFVPIMVV